MGLIIAGCLFTFLTVGVGAILVKKIHTTYKIYNERVFNLNKKVDQLAQTRIVPSSPKTVENFGQPHQKEKKEVKEQLLSENLPNSLVAESSTDYKKIEKELTIWAESAKNKEHRTYQNRNKAKEAILKCIKNKAKYLELFDLDEVPDQIKYLKIAKLTLVEVKRVRIPYMPNLQSLHILRSTFDLSFIDKKNCFIDKKNCENLTSLAMRRCELKDIPKEIFSLINLKSLDLAENNLQAITGGINALNKLNSLDLSQNRQLRQLSEMTALKELSSLRLVDTGLTSFPTQFKEFTHLTLLDLSQNKLSFLPEEIRSLTQLTSLCLMCNKLERIPNEIGSLTQLTSLDLSNNKLENIPNEIGSLTQLTSLDLSSNRLENIPNEIGLLTQLKSLNVSSNNLEAIPTQIGLLKELNSLIVFLNKLHSLPDEMGLLKNLKTINLRSNLLTTLPPSLLRLAELTIGAEYNRFSADYVRDVQERQNSARAHNQSFANVTLTIHEEKQEVSITPLPGIINFWKKQLEPKDWADFKTLEDKDHSSDLRDFLVRLKETKDYKNAKSENVKRMLAVRIMKILEEMVETPAFRDVAFPYLPEANIACGDRITLGLNQLEILLRIERLNIEMAEDKTINRSMELAIFAMGLKRLELITEEAKALKTTDPVETELFLQLELKEALNLPIQSESMLYDKMSGVSPEHLQNLLTKIKDSTHSEREIVNALVQQSFWQTFLRNQDKKRYNSLAKTKPPSEIIEEGEVVVKAWLNGILLENYEKDTKLWLQSNGNQEQLLNTMNS